MNVSCILNLTLLLIPQKEDGAELLIHGKKTTIFGTVATICADNPGSCALGGFKESGSAYRLCRQCLVTSDEIKAMVSIVELVVIPFTCFPD